MDLYSPVIRHQQRAFSKQFAEVGWHTIRVTHTGTANGSSGGMELFTDGFAYSF